MKTVKEIKSQIEALKNKLEAIKDRESKEGKAEAKHLGKKLTFMFQIQHYAEHRNKASKNEILMPTNRKGVIKLFKQLKRLHADIRRDPKKEFSYLLTDLKYNIEYLQRLAIQTKKANKPQAPTQRKTRSKKIQLSSGQTIKNGETINWFSWDGLKLIKPKQLQLISAEHNVFAASEVQNISLDPDIVKDHVEQGNYLVVLRQLGKPKNTAIFITQASILKAREQRLQLAYTGGEGTVASLIKRDLEGGVDKRLKDPKKIIEKHKEDFLSAFSYNIIMRDIDRIIKIQ
jgi:hypothetical protein